MLNLGALKTWFQVFSITSYVKRKGYIKKEQAICSLESIEIGVERKANETLIGKRGKKRTTQQSNTHDTTRGQGKGENPDNITTDRHLFRAM